MSQAILSATAELLGIGDEAGSNQPSGRLWRGRSGYTATRAGDSRKGKQRQRQVGNDQGAQIKESAIPDPKKTIVRPAFPRMREGVTPRGNRGNVELSATGEKPTKETHKGKHRQPMGDFVAGKLLYLT